jgi:chromosome segregation ATPase
MMDQMKEDLGSTDDEFAALQPKIEAVMAAQRDAMGGMRFGGGRRNQNGGGGGQQGPQSDVQEKVADLRTTLENKDASADEIKEKLDALRAARAKAKETLTAAQADLKGLLTARQEAVLVGYGMLE